MTAVLVEGLTHRFGDHLAVDGATWSSEEGEVFGLLGPNGAGKTTTLRVLTTLVPPQAGRAEVFGTDVRRAMAVRRSIGYVPQQLSVESVLTGRENVALMARLYDVPRRGLRAAVAEALELVGLSEAADRQAATYSGGMVRRLELAQALVHRPRLLVLDEPTIGLDPVARDGVWARIGEQVRGLGMSVLVTTHYMEEADRFCDRVALMHRGRVRVVGRPAELRAGLGGDATLDDVFRHFTGDDAVATDEGEGFSDVRSTRRTARRLG